MAQASLDRLKRRAPAVYWYSPAALEVATARRLRRARATDIGLPAVFSTFLLKCQQPVKGFVGPLVLSCGWRCGEPRWLIFPVLVLACSCACGILRMRKPGDRS
jgi:hypothetical protein